MLEKDIENLIATYPEEFLPYEGLKLVGQQVKLDSYYADIVFETVNNGKIIIEVKRGILPRDAIGQIMDYYGIINIQEKWGDVELVIAANVIPKERVILLSQKLVGIKFLEISVAKIAEVAKKHAYSFLDDSKRENHDQYTKKSSLTDSVIPKTYKNVWIFQSNPQRFDILNALTDPLMLQDNWQVSRFKERIQIGDTVIIWMSGKDGGIYALGEVVSGPAYMEDPELSKKYWVSDWDKSKVRLCVMVKYTLKFLNDPILKEELKQIPVLRNLSIFKQPQGTNFQVTPEEWHAILELIKKR